MAKATDIVEPLDVDVESNLKDFTELLKNINSLDDKKRALWRNVYENSVADRQNSYVVFRQVFNIIDNKSTDYAIHARTLTACIERMQKANEQLIKLAELVERAEQKDQQVDPDELYLRIKH